MTAQELAAWNAHLHTLAAPEIVRWALDRAEGRAVVSTNFRPYEAVILHLVTREQPDIPVIWVDHGYNRPATYRHAEQLRSLLRLNLHVYHPRLSAAHYDAIYGPPPAPGLENEERLKAFSAVMKLEPFRRAMRELAPRVWFTALRRVQNPHRAGLDILSEDPNFSTWKVSPVFEWSDAQMEDYLSAHGLPNEWDYFDPAKADEKRECGLHVAWGESASGGGGNKGGKEVQNAPIKGDNA